MLSPKNTKTYNKNKQSQQHNNKPVTPQYLPILCN